MIPVWVNIRWLLAGHIVKGLENVICESYIWLGKKWEIMLVIIRVLMEINKLQISQQKYVHCIYCLKVY